MELIEFASAEAFLEPARLCLEREEAWRSLGLALRLQEEAQSGSLGSVRGSVFGRIIPAAVLTAQRRRVDSRIRQDDAGTVAPGQSGDVAARVA